MRAGIAVAALLAGAAPAFAHENVPPDPATIVLPDMTPSQDERVIANGWKYFYFHRTGVSYAAAYADFTECYRFLSVQGLSGELPAFTPWTEPFVPLRAPPRSSNLGLVGDLMIGAFATPFDRRGTQARLRRCLEPRGYVRYPLRKETWEQLVDNYSEASIARQALAAAGPTPDTSPVTR